MSNVVPLTRQMLGVLRTHAEIIMQHSRDWNRERERETETWSGMLAVFEEARAATTIATPAGRAATTVETKATTAA